MWSTQVLSQVSSFSQMKIVNLSWKVHIYVFITCLIKDLSLVATQDLSQVASSSGFDVREVFKWGRESVEDTESDQSHQLMNKTSIKSQNWCSEIVDWQLETDVKSRLVPNTFLVEAREEKWWYLTINIAQLRSLLFYDMLKYNILQYMLSNLTRRKWWISDLEQDSG